MLKSEDWCGQYWGLHLEFVGLNPWHEILHEWNARVPQILEYKHHKSWGGRLRCVIIGNWRATLRTFHPIVEQNEH